MSLSPLRSQAVDYLAFPIITSENRELASEGELIEFTYWENRAREGFDREEKLLNLLEKSTKKKGIKGLFGGGCGD